MKSTSVASFVVRPALALAAAAALTGCASNYQLTLMPRNSGTLFYGDAVEQSAGGEAIVTVNIDEKIYTGNWVPVSSGRSSGFVSGGIGWGGGGRGRYGGIGVGTAPVVIDNGDGAAAKALLQAADGSVLLAHDENIREANTPEKLATLRTIYEPGANGLDAWGLAREPELGQIAHVHTAGNAPCMADGAAAVLLGSEAAARRLGLPVRARVLAQADACVPLTQTGAVDSTQKALARCGLTVADIDLWEVRDSFSVITLHYIDTLGIDLERFNVNGSSIALGHPMGATGAMLVSCLLDEMEMRGARYGVAAVPGAFGVATATVFERLVA
jgi:acetyl-CoA C-acetyltransferase